MNRLLGIALLLGVVPATAGAPSASADRESGKEALKALQEFIGEWKGAGGPDKPRSDPRDPVWKETLVWSWRFKGDEAWLTLEVKGGKHLAGGELRYLPGKNKYQFTAAARDGGRQVFEGELKDETLRLERTDPDTKDTQLLSMNVAGDGVRFIYRAARRPAGGTIVRKEYLVAATKEGESLAAREKKNECVVSGGVGTMTVSYKGEVYYVCCSGCRDAFNENPEKYVAEFKAKKAGKK